MYRIISFPKKLLFILYILISFTGCFLVDDSPLKTGDGRELGEPRFASGPANGQYYQFSKGVIDSANETLGIFMENIATQGTLENAKKLVSGSTYMGDAYMGIVQEDLFRYAQQKYESQFASDPATAEKVYLKIASQIKVVLALYDEDLHLLVNTNSGISEISDLAGKTVNLGPANSGTYITAKTVMDAHGFSYTAKTDDIATGINGVAAGTYDAAFYVTASPSPLIQALGASAQVKLIQAQMPSSGKIYDENGTILAGDYPFQTDDVGRNIKVKSLLAAGPRFDDTTLRIFLDYIFTHADEYKSFTMKWEEISLTRSADYMRKNPELCNYRSMLYVSGFPEIDPFYLEPEFLTGYGISSSHDMYVELDYLLTYNLGIGLREWNTTGTWENAYRLLNGQGSMALVQEDIFSYLKESNDMYDSMMAANMKKVVPLHYEYVHVLINNTGAKWTQWSGVPTNLQDVFTDIALNNPLAPVLHINVGPKTSGTFITAMKIINSYKSYNSTTADSPDLLDMEDMEIHYHFDSPHDAILKVNNGDYHMAFVVSGLPYDRFYSHDTWDLSTDLGNCRIIPANFYNGSVPAPYREGIIKGGGNPTYENYPYDISLLPADITTTRVRALQVVAAPLDVASLDTYVKSVFRKSYYLTNPPDPDLWPEGYPYGNSLNSNGVDNDGDGYTDDWFGYQPDQLWINIKKESSVADTSRAVYEDVVGAREYFVKNPFGWSRDAAEYLLTMFPDN